MSGAIPLQSGCNPDDPEEHVMWAFIGLPGPGNNAPMVLPPPVLRKWSKQLVDAGFRHHPELQKIKYVPPSSTASWMLGSAGRWVPIDEELPADVTAPDTSGLTVDEKRVLLERLTAEFKES